MARGKRGSRSARTLAPWTVDPDDEATEHPQGVGRAVEAASASALASTGQRIAKAQEGESGAALARVVVEAAATSFHATLRAARAARKLSAQQSIVPPYCASAEFAAPPLGGSDGDASMEAGSRSSGSSSRASRALPWASTSGPPTVSFELLPELAAAEREASRRGAPGAPPPPPLLRWWISASRRRLRRPSSAVRGGAAPDGRVLCSPSCGDASRGENCGTTPRGSASAY